MRFTATYLLKKLIVSSLIVSTALAASFPVMNVPKDNPQSVAKSELGRQLFYDQRLSADDTVSCSSCHIQSLAFSNAGNAVSTGIKGQKGSRNAPSLGNAGYRKSLFWEGGSPSLELQAMGPITAHDEMGMEPETLVKKLRGIAGYDKQFKNVFKDGVTMLNITRALASFERTLVTNSSPYDRFNKGDQKAMNDSAVRGLELFFGEKGDCFHCHGGFNFTDEQLHNTGLYKTYKDEGLARITKRKEDIGKFKTPSLRNVALTAPYMHDGSRKTLRDVLNDYNSGGQPHDNADGLMRPLELSKQDISDLIAFLESLTDQGFVKNPKFAKPAKLP
jgi:cytochrome c peroxidase